MTAPDIRLDFGVILAVFLALTLFGIGYNALVAWLERNRYTEGYLSLIVALGVLITLLGVAILSLPSALLALLAFTATGMPMIIGSIARYITRRAQARRTLIEETHDQTA